MKVVEKLSKDQIKMIDTWAQKKELPDVIKRVFNGTEYIVTDYIGSEDNKHLVVPTILQYHLELGGYVVVDYFNGLCAKGKQQISIGKALKKLKVGEDVINVYANDKQRAASAPIPRKIIYTINNYDVACMSTFKGWTSCMQLTGGGNSHYLEKDLKFGTIAAFLVHETDVDIENPIARIAIKQFINEEDSNFFTYRPEERVYGNGPASFLPEVKKWCQKTFSAKANSFYILNSGLYGDSGVRDYVKIRHISKLTPEFRETLFSKKADAIASFSNPSEELQIAAVSCNAGAYRFLKNPSDSVKVAALKMNHNLIMDIPEPTEEMQLVVVTNNGYYLRHIKNPTPKVCEVALESDWSSIQFVKNQTDNMKWMVIKKTPRAIQFCTDPTEEMQLHVIEEDPMSLRYLQKPSRNAVLKAVSKCGDLLRYSPFMDDQEIQLAALNQSGEALFWIQSPTNEMKMIALAKNPSLIRHIANPTQEMKKLAVDTNPSAIRWIRNPSEDLQLIAVNHDGFYIEHIMEAYDYGGKLSDAVIEAAIRNNPEVVRYFGRRHYPALSKKMQLFVIEQDKALIELINEPCDEALIASGKFTEEELLKKKVRKGRGNDPFSTSFSQSSSRSANSAETVEQGSEIQTKDKKALNALYGQLNDHNAALMNIALQRVWTTYQDHARHRFMVPGVGWVGDR